MLSMPDSSGPDQGVTDEILLSLHPIMKEMIEKHRFSKIIFLMKFYFKQTSRPISSDESEA